MTKQEAKKLSLEVWAWLRDNAPLTKVALPPRIRNKIRHMSHWCPLCDLFNHKSGFITACDSECPLGDCISSGAYWNKWFQNADERRHYAGLIYDQIKAWRISKRGGKQ